MGSRQSFRHLPSLWQKCVSVRPRFFFCPTESVCCGWFAFFLSQLARKYTRPIREQTPTKPNRTEPNRTEPNRHYRWCLGKEYKIIPSCCLPCCWCHYMQDCLHIRIVSFCVLSLCVLFLYSLAVFSFCVCVAHFVNNIQAISRIMRGPAPPLMQSTRTLGQQCAQDGLDYYCCI